METGKLVISLDFELLWGLLDKRKLVNDFNANVSAVRLVFPRLLEMFQKYEIHATFATVGFLFFQSLEEMKKGLPDIKPAYLNTELSPYDYLNTIGENEENDPGHYASSLIQSILSTPFQEIGTHTFSHFYCLENGQTADAFKADLNAAIEVARNMDIKLNSLVFPRNQFNKTYLSVCNELGIECFRGNEPSWIYAAKNGENESLIRRGIRLMDAYINISGHNAFNLKDVNNGSMPVNIPSSRFLRPYSKKLKFFEPLRLQRILSGLTFAAKKSLVYHLWWHPHNFGKNIDDNFLFLEKILQHFSYLRDKFGMDSLNMSEVGSIFERERAKTSADSD